VSRSFRFIGLSVSACLASSIALAQPEPEPVAPVAPQAPEPTPPSPPPTPSPDPPPSPSAPSTPPAPPERTAPEKTTPPVVATTATAAKKDEKPEKPNEHTGKFEFGSYGRVVAAMDGDAGPGRDADVVAHGSRLDENNYVELELRREDYFPITDTSTRIVATLAVAAPIFHYDGEFDINLAIRNLFIEERDLGLEGLSVWAGSRMLRGDDIYLLDFWPLDNLNTLGGGVGYRHDIGLATMLHVGVSKPDTPFYQQSVERPAPLDQFGSTQVAILSRQRIIGSLRVAWDQRLSDAEGPSPGLKAVLYSELHHLPPGEREDEPKVYEALPADGGFVIGGQIGAYTGERDTHIHAFVRYATGLAAYGQFASPGQLAENKTTDGAHELVIAAGGNAEFGPIGVMLGAYLRSFRDASPALNFDDVDEGIVAVRPTVFFDEYGGLSLEGSYQLAQRGVIAPDPDDPEGAPTGPRLAGLFRFGVVPFLSPAGKGSFSRPHIRFIYALTARNAVARTFYPEDDVFARRELEHFIGFGAEWWFNTSSYGF
jgi:maltoporin